MSRAGVDLPAQMPARCRAATAHAAATLGAEAVSVLKRERGQLDVANADKRDCAGWYAGLAKRLAP